MAEGVKSSVFHDIVREDMEGDIVLTFCDFGVGAEGDMHLADIYAACVLVVLESFEVHVGRDVAVAWEGNVGVDNH